MIKVPPHSLIAMSAVLCLLVIASLVTWVKRVRSPERDYQELKLRIQSWWWMVAVLFLMLSLSDLTAIVFFGFLSFLALKEFLSIVPSRQTDRNVMFWLYLSIPIQYYWVAVGWYGVFIIFIPVYVFLFIPMRMVLIGDTQGFIRAAGSMHWAVMLTVFSLSHIPYLLTLPTINSNAGGIGLVIYLLFMTQFNDVCQFVWGKSIGKHKLIPKVSPNKTWEGLIGGVSTVTLCSALVAPLLTPLSMLQGLVAGGLIGISGFFGDVVLSSVKRDLQIKDSGHLIPGHGGILDRLDSLIYTAPLFFHYLYYLYY
ncbi:phosphatidate cytidylyltransferase [Aliagarivorans marinus]|uniref:phosphatidate cytidylyltransferase n=1 Tax=Aliagarivorans marinus TaxID=561965 RepID=UPI000403D6A2|nr:phosphatidate cytidylyltransferase [Aliagarivorans marinus]